MALYLLAIGQGLAEQDITAQLSGGCLKQAGDSCIQLLTGRGQGIGLLQPRPGHDSLSHLHGLLLGLT
jgi:hypothetical protein